MASNRRLHVRIEEVNIQYLEEIMRKFFVPSMNAALNLVIKQHAQLCHSGATLVPKLAPPSK